MHARGGEHATTSLCAALGHTQTHSAQARGGERHRTVENNAPPTETSVRYVHTF